MNYNYLIEKPSKKIYFKNRRYSLRCSFDNVLEVQRLYRDERFTDYEKAEQALKMLLANGFKLRLLSKTLKIELMSRIFEEQIKIPTKPVKGNSGPRVLDFYLDSEYIYASFRSDYGMDLIQEQGKLHWKEFIQLFQGLSDKSKIKEIMHIRQMEIPVPTKHNRKQIQSIIELKSYYGLPVEGGGGQKGLDALFGTLEQVAISGK